MPKINQQINLARYRIIPRSLVFIFNGNNVILMKEETKESGWFGYYNGLGGHIERGEDVLLAARREIFEESGLWIEKLRIAGVCFIDAEPANGVGLFIITGTTHENNLTGSLEGTPEWIAIDQLENITILDDAKQFIHRILNDSNNLEPFSAFISSEQSEKKNVKFYDDVLS